MGKKTAAKENLGGKDEEFFGNYFKYVSNVIPEMTNGTITHDQALSIARAKWNTFSEQQRTAFSICEKIIKFEDKVVKNLSVKKAVAPVETRSSAFSKESEEKPLRPKKPTTPYICYMTKVVRETQQQEGNKYQETFSKCAAAWSGMTEEEKKPFVDEAATDQDRFDREMKQFKETGFFTNSQGVNSADLPRVKAKIKKSAKSASKDSEPQILKPKKAMVSFMFFVKNQTKKVMEENKDIKSAADITKCLG